MTQISRITLAASALNQLGHYAS